MEIKVIGHVSSCFKEKFGIPRQSGQAPSSFGNLALIAPYNREEALRGLETFSHMIITWAPHIAKENTSLTVKPPRLGGNKKIGVFASRSPFRPNAICSSIVKIEKIDFEKAQIYFSNHDLLDGTPVLDIKPYIPQWDIFEDAHNGWISDYPESKMSVTFKDSFEITKQDKELIKELLSLDPKPRYQSDKKSYVMQIENLDVQFTYLNAQEVQVTNILKLS